MNSKRSVKKVNEKRDLGPARRTLRATLDVLTDVGLMEQIAESRWFYQAGKKGFSFEDVFGEPLVPVKKRRTLPPHEARSK